MLRFGGSGLRLLLFEEVRPCKGLDCNRDMFGS